MLVLFSFLYLLAIFYPDYIHLSPLFIIVLLFSLLFLNEKISLSLVSIFVLISLFSVSIYRSVPSFSVPEEEIVTLYGRSMEESRVREGGNGFSLSLSSGEDRFGNSFSLRGNIYIIAGHASVGTGDIIKLHGSFISERIFIADHVEVMERSPFWTVRRKYRSFLRSHFEPVSIECRDMALLLLLGRSEAPGGLLMEKGREKGVSHIFALSGMHLVVISGLLSFPLSFFLDERRAKQVMLFPLFVFTFLSSFIPSLFRSFLMYLLGTLFGIKGENLLLATFIIHALLFPSDIFLSSSVLSYLAVSGIIYFSPSFPRHHALRYLPVEGICISLSALAFTVPYTLLTFGSYTFSSLLFSILLSPLISLFMITSILSFILPFIIPFLSLLMDVISFLLMLDVPDVREESIWPYVFSLFSLFFLKVLQKKREKRLYSSRVESEL